MQTILNYHFNWADLADILLVTLLLYQLIMLLKGTRALAVLYGLGLMALLYLLSLLFGFYTVSWLLSNVFSSLFLVIVVIFQRDIRQALGVIGARNFFRRSHLEEDVLREMAEACLAMAWQRVGALIVIERSMPLGDMIRSEGVMINAIVSRKLLMNIFYPKAPLHDGAVIISRGRITAGACILPLAVVPPGQNFGTRHRAAIGITEESDAVAVVVSEERGEISVASKGVLLRNIELDVDKIKQVISDVL